MENICKTAIYTGKAAVEKDKNITKFACTWLSWRLSEQVQVFRCKPADVTGEALKTPLPEHQNFAPNDKKNRPIRTKLIMCQIVIFTDNATQADLFTPNVSDKVVIRYKSVYDTTYRTMEVMSFGVDGARARITCNCVRETIRHMIAARDTKAGHYSERVWRGVEHLKGKVKMLPQGADLIKLANDIRRLGIIDLLESIKPHKDNRYYRNFNNGLAALNDFVAKNYSKISA